MNRRIDIKKILSNPRPRRELFARVIRAIQAREGIETTMEQAYNAYDYIQIEKKVINKTKLTKKKLNKD